jgi:peptide subunit release factor 1 (eRF1)
MTVYEIECPICTITSLVRVKYESEEETPQHCPMCGEDCEPEEVEDFLE